MATELDHRRGRFIVDLFVLQNVPHRFLVQRLEVKAVAGVEVSGHRLWVGVDHDTAHTDLGEGRGSVDAAVIELDALADANRSAANDHRLLAFQGRSFILLVIGAVVIRGDGLEFGGTGVNGLVDRPKTPFMALITHLFR